MDFSDSDARMRRPFKNRASGADFFRTSTVRPIPLPPEVANATMVFPENEVLSRNVSTIRGAIPHQIGKPTNTVSYGATSMAESKSDRLASSRIYSVERVPKYLQFKSAFM